MITLPLGNPRDVNTIMLSRLPARLDLSCFKGDDILVSCQLKYPNGSFFDFSFYNYLYMEVYSISDIGVITSLVSTGTNKTWQNHGQISAVKIDSVKQGKFTFRIGFGVTDNITKDTNCQYRFYAYETGAIRIRNTLVEGKVTVAEKGGL